MKEDIFDNIGKRLSEYSSPVDLGAEWQAIVNRQKKAQRRRRNVLLLLFLLLAIVSSSVYLYRSQSATVAPKASSESEQIQTSTSPTVPQSDERTEVATQANSTAASKEQAIASNNQHSQTNHVPPNQLSTIELTTSNTTAKPSPASDKAASNSSKGGIVETQKVSSNRSTALFGSVLPKIASKIPSWQENPLPNIAVGVYDDVEKPSPKSRFQLFLYSGIASSGQQLKAKNTASVSYADQRNTTEKALETYTFDIGLNAFVGKKSFVRLGMNYSIAYDKLSHQHDIPKTYLFENVLLKRITNRATGEVEEIYGNTAIEGTQTVNTTQHNRYTTIGIDLSFGHYLLQRERISLALTAGLSQNLHLKTEGKILSSADPDGPLQALEEYKNSYGLGLLGGVDLDYRLTRSLLLSLRPAASYALFSATEETSPLDANFYRFGISLGLKYRL